MLTARRGGTCGVILSGASAQRRTPVPTEELHLGAQGSLVASLPQDDTMTATRPYSPASRCIMGPACSNNPRALNRYACASPTFPPPLCVFSKYPSVNIAKNLAGQLACAPPSAESTSAISRQT